MPKCMKMEGHVHCTKKYKTAQLGHTAGEDEIQPLSLSFTIPLNLNPGSWNKRTLCTVLYLCV